MVIIKQGGSKERIEWSLFLFDVNLLNQTAIAINLESISVDASMF